MLTQARLQELLFYDPETGVMTWRVTRRGKARAGTPFGNLTKEGYIRGWVDWNIYYAHCLVWLYVTGRWAKNEIDHIDRNKINNRIDNLREATRGQNRMNACVQRNSQTGIKGVTHRKDTGRYRAYGHANGKIVWLGQFETLDKAKQARLAFVATHYGEFARE